MFLYYHNVLERKRLSDIRLVVCRQLQIIVMTPDRAEAAVENELRDGARLMGTAKGYLNESGRH